MNQVFFVQKSVWRGLLWAVAAILCVEVHGEDVPKMLDDDGVREFLVGFWIGAESDRDTAARDFATFTTDGRYMGRWEYGRPTATVSYYSGTFRVQSGVVDVSFVPGGRNAKVAEPVRFRVEIVSDNVFRRTDEGSGRVLKYHRRPTKDAPPKHSPAIPATRLPGADSSAKPRIGG